MSQPDVDPKLLTRRRWLNRAIFGLSGLAGAVVGVPIIAYLLSPLINPARNVWRDLGPLDQFPPGQTVQVNFQDPSPLAWAGQTATQAAWLRRQGPTDFQAFSVNCTHLGCPVRWLPTARLFLCPCHGGVYYDDGRVAGGPPPRPLFRYDVRVENGHVFLLTRGLQVG